VVEPVDVLSNGDFQVVDVLPWALVADQLGLEQRVEGLGQSVVVGVAGRADGGHGAGLGQPLGVANREVLHSLVAVVGQARDVAALALAGPDPHLQGVQGQVGAQRLRQLPADHAPGVDVDHERGVDPPGEAQWWPLPTSTPAHPRGTTCSISCSPRTHDYRVARRTPRRQIRKQRPERASQSAVEAPRRTGQPIHRSHQGQSRLSHTRPHRATQQLTDPGLTVLRLDRGCRRFEPGWADFFHAPDQSRSEGWRRYGFSQRQEPFHRVQSGEEPGGFRLLSEPLRDCRDEP